MAYDQMIGEDNPKGNALVQAAIDALLEQTKTIEKVVGPSTSAPWRSRAPTAWTTPTRCSSRSDADRFGLPAAEAPGLRQRLPGHRSRCGRRAWPWPR